MTKKLINAFNEVLVNGYKAAIELKALEREVDYDTKFSEIEARAYELRPVRRRHWYWLLCTFPNRAQAIIEKRAELDADKEHTAAEKKLDDDWEQLYPDGGKLSKRELRRELKKKLKAAIKNADKTETNEAFDEPADTAPAPMHDVAPVQAQPQPAPTNNDYATLTDKAAAGVTEKGSARKTIARANDVGRRTSARERRQARTDTTANGADTQTKTAAELSAIGNARGNERNHDDGASFPLLDKKKG